MRNLENTTEICIGSMKITMNEVMPSDKAMIKDVVETIDNPFDTGKSFLGLITERLEGRKGLPKTMKIMTTSRNLK